MFLNWNEYRSSLLSVIGKFAKMQPEFMKGLAQMDKGVSEHGHLDAKTRELISLAVAVTTRCDGCLAVHVDAAAKHGDERRDCRGVVGGDSPEHRCSVGLYGAGAGYLR